MSYCVKHSLKLRILSYLSLSMIMQKPHSLSLLVPSHLIREGSNRLRREWGFAKAQASLCVARISPPACRLLAKAWWFPKHRG